MRKGLWRVLAVAAFFVGGGPAFYAQGPTQNQVPTEAKSRAEEMLAMWNDIGGKLVAMADDFPAENYDYKLKPEQRTFAENLLHVAAVDYDLMSSVAGTKRGPDFGKNKHNPSREMYKSKADVVKLIRDAVADGAQVIREQGDAGLDQASKMPWGNRMAHGSYKWMFAIEHSGEHYGQLVVYYRANGMVPPDSRR